MTGPIVDYLSRLTVSSGEDFGSLPLTRVMACVTVRELCAQVIVYLSDSEFNYFYESDDFVS